ncbi:MAG: Stk1 family PASTA domain-containing Ser/Thr kinase [Firmicutes bacterium]|nr:Stk1 family PASTA domain-containing Ser/Thr kinase [Bacillota bacterium]
MIGRKLGNRYEMLERIGRGGMSLVYRAQDTLLQRVVAIKVLRSQFVNDSEFVKRFRREGQAAASLSHPNIVSLYDVGQEDDFYYLVMEYVDGETLKDRIATRGPIPVLQSMKIAHQICEALEHAHQHRVVHRDIKPHNILITKDGRVKVTDFGIARAATEATITNTGAIIGSVHYFSPEQARGGFTGEKSDLYSLGVVLYEMLTGKVPFEGETPISVALKHLQEPAPEPTSLNPEIPPAVQRIVLKALEKNQGDRYQSAGEMLADIGAYLKNPELSPSSGERSRPRAVPPPVAGRGGEATDAEERSRKQNKRKKKGPSRAFFWAALLLLLIGLAFYGMKSFFDWFNVPTVEVPAVVGKSLIDAQKELTAIFLIPIVVAQQNDPTVPFNFIIAQLPGAGELVKEGREVRLTVSKGPEMVEIPPLVRKSSKEATLILQGLGLTANVRLRHDPEVPEDYVISQNPREGVSVKKGTAVDLEVSQGPEQIMLSLPNFAGEKLDNVLLRLAALKLTKGQITEVASSLLAGTVVGQDPAAGTMVAEGSAVNFSVSKGGGASRQSSLSIKVPQGTQPIRVLVRVTDSRGARTVLNEDRTPGQEFTISIEWTGETATAEVFFNGSLYRKDVWR